MIFADTSFFFSAYGNDGNSATALAKMRSLRAPIFTTDLGVFEFENALRFAAFRKVYSESEIRSFSAAFSADCGLRLIRLAPIDLADVVAEARRLSANYTVQNGHRSFDILHVAAALIGQARNFLTFDANQRKLAEAEGLLVG